MSARPNLTPNRIRELLDYEPATGLLFWKVKPSMGVAAGAIAGHLTRRGYVAVRILGHEWKVHRIAWAHYFGSWPTAEIDHINGQKADNRIANLRDVDRTTNQENMRRANSNSSTGLLGASPHKTRFVATIKVRGVHTRIGSFATAEEAHAAYLTAKRALHAGGTI